MKNTKKILLILWSILLFLVLVITAINFYVLSFSKTNYYIQVNDLPEKYVGLVLWASVKWNSMPSDILKDRLDVAFQAYEEGKIKKFLVSGDNSKLYYNEPEVMKNYLVWLWANKNDIYLDYAGFDTYSSLYRARDIFLVDELIIFTQDFHLKRAMYIGKKLGIETYGIETNLRRYLKENYYDFREVFARVKAFLNVDVLYSSPKYLWDQIEIITDEQIEEVKKWIIGEENN